MGPDQVVLGSDYPFPLGEHGIGKVVRDSHFSAETKAKLLSQNAERFLGLESETKAESATTAGDCPVSNPVKAPDVTTSGKLTYSSYLKVPELLRLQELQATPARHDELLFIIIHQTYELWFKELLHDLDAVVASLRAVATNPSSRDEVYEAARLLRRCTEIMRVLVSQFTILETMLPTHFLAFREKLAPASGFQSEQFREIEFLCGLKDEKMLQHHTGEERTRLARRLYEPSLHDVFFDALRALGKLHEPPNASEAEKFDARANAVRDIYQDEKNYRDWIDVCERLTEFDELVVGWRLRHVQMVERTIGLKMGTGGSAGSSYLRLTLDKKFFPELWEARTMLTPPDQTK
jgi:tryptophan 2,3-dioxygenase